MDLSFIKGDEKVACAALVICTLPDLHIVYEDIAMVPLTTPYIPGMFIPLALCELCGFCMKTYQFKMVLLALSYVAYIVCTSLLDI
jgi:hypothetical protein